MILLQAAFVSDLFSAPRSGLEAVAETDGDAPCEAESSGTNKIC
jgi:hypothetical protein